MCTNLLAMPRGGVDLLLHEHLLLLLQRILLLHHELLLPLVLLLQTKGHLPLQLPWWTPGGGAEGLTRCGGVAACHARAASTLHFTKRHRSCEAMSENKEHEEMPVRNRDEHWERHLFQDDVWLLLSFCTAVAKGGF